MALATLRPVRLLCYAQDGHLLVAVSCGDAVDFTSLLGPIFMAAHLKCLIRLDCYSSTRCSPALRPCILTTFPLHADRVPLHQHDDPAALRGSEHRFLGALQLGGEYTFQEATFSIACTPVAATIFGCKHTHTGAAVQQIGKHFVFTFDCAFALQ